MTGRGDLFSFEPPPSYPDSSGFKGTAETGREAAEAIAPRCGRLQRLTLDARWAAGTHG